MIKFRIGSGKLQEVDSFQKGIELVKTTQKSRPCIFEVLIYEGATLSAMDRYHYDGERFHRENFTN